MFQHIWTIYFFAPGGRYPSIPRNYFLTEQSYKITHFKLVKIYHPQQEEKALTGQLQVQVVKILLQREEDYVSFCGEPAISLHLDYPYASRHEGPRFKSPGGYLCETGISPVNVVSLRFKHYCLKLFNALLPQKLIFGRLPNFSLAMPILNIEDTKNSHSK